MDERDNSADEAVGHIWEHIEVDCDYVMEHHLNVIVLLLVTEAVMNESSDVVAHCPNEVESVEGRLIDVWKVDELVFELTMASESRG